MQLEAAFIARHCLGPCLEWAHPASPTLVPPHRPTPAHALPQCVAEIPRPSPRPGSSSIISSLEFDRQGALFATAGVSKRVRWAGRQRDGYGEMGRQVGTVRRSSEDSQGLVCDFKQHPSSIDFPQTRPTAPHPHHPPRSIFDYASVVPAAGGPGVHAPAVELLSRSKLSCLSWNKYIQAHIASSDYEGG